MTAGAQQPGAGGRCACGGVTYRVSGQLRTVVNCHCDRCRRITGHFMAATSADLDDLDLVADETLRWYEPVEGVAYGFCGSCGSSLFWRNDAEPHRWSISAGTLDPPTGLTTSKALWMADVSDYHPPQPDLDEHLHD